MKFILASGLMTTDYGRKITLLCYTYYLLMLYICKDQI